MTIKFANNATSTLAGAITAASTTVVLQAGDGAKFPALSGSDTFMLTLIKMVSGLPVIEIVKVTARSADTLTVVRGQESTTATTFSAGDRAENRLTSGAMDDMGQKSSANTWSATNDFTLSPTMPTPSAADNSTKGATTAYVQGSYAKKGANSDITSLAGLTTALSISQGGTGQTTGPNACNALGAVQMGTGIGQGSNIVKLGWGTSSGLKVTIDTSDQGYIPTSSTNPFSGGTITYANPLTAQAANFTTVTASGLMSANAGLQVNNTATLILGGALGTLANNAYMQIGGFGGLNLALDYTNIQARSNGSATTLNLNNLGGLVQIGSGGLSTTGSATIGQLISTGLAQIDRSAGDDKIQLKEGANTRGYITAASSHCFGVVNAAHTVQALLCDNSGNFTAAGNITANSDERLKENWRKLRDDFLDRLADISLVGLYDRIDTLETQIGMSAQQVRTFAPELVHVDPVSGILSLDYGKLGAVSAVLAAQKLREMRAEIEQLKKGAA